MVLLAAVSKFTLFVLPLWWGLLITELQGLKNDDDVGGGGRIQRLLEDEVNLIMPQAIEQGADLELICQFNSTTFPPLYSVKWYKGTREFFRFSPRELPAKKTLKWDGVTVDEFRSDINRVYLRNVPLQLTGIIKCQLTIEHTMKEVEKTQSLTVIVQAKYPPILETSAGHSKYVRQGDTLRLVCTSGPSKPAANLTFYINNVPYTDRSFRQSPHEVGDAEGDNRNWGMESRRAVVNVTLNDTLFVDYKIKIKCAAVIYTYFNYSREYEWELPPSRPAASSYGNHNSLTNSATLLHSSGKICSIGIVWSVWSLLGEGAAADYRFQVF